jgi:hypothetical protein
MSTRGSAIDRAMYGLLPRRGITPSYHIVHTHLRVLLTDYTPERLEFGEGLRVGATRAAPSRRDAGWQTR